jgi:membrane-bound lytic murein transglycosylase MltF
MKTISILGRLMFWMVASQLLVTSAPGQTSDAPQSEPAAAEEVRKLELSNKPWTGDFDRMLQRRIIRVLAPYSRSLYFNDKGHERGLTAEIVRDFERWINKKYAQTLGRRPLTVYIIPSTRDKLLPELVSGMGDAAIGNLTVTEERLKIADFVSPEGVRIMRELVVTGPQSPAIASVDDLSGETVHVRKASSYYASLEALNVRFKQDGKPPVNLILVPDALEDEDMMEMLNAGLLGIIVVDDWKAKMWAQVLPRIRVNEQAAVREAGRVGTAIRKGSPKFEAEMLEFY